MPIALVLERALELSLREIDLPLDLAPDAVCIKTEVVGICGSDVHYYQHGRIGPFVVTAAMVLGHEAAGVVVEVGCDVTTLRVGDRVCVEPGVPDFTSRASRLGRYNLDPALTFWATPPDHGCLTPHVVHPAALCYKLPDNVSAAQGAMVEPLAVCIQAATKARIQPGDMAVALGAGPIGLLQALAARASGCSDVYIFDPLDKKLDVAARYPGIHPLYGRNGSPAAQIAAATGGWGADVLFECSGAAAAYRGMADMLRPGGTVVAVGMPIDPVPVDIVALQMREIALFTVFRYANVYDRAINLLASGQIDLEPLITGTYEFADSIAAFKRAAEGRAEDIKIQIRMPA